MLLQVHDLYKKEPIIKVLYSFILLASLILVVNISIETFRHDSFLQHSIFFKVQFWICIYFTISFFIFLFLSEEKIKFLFKYSIILLLSIPYLNILEYTSLQLTKEQTYLISFVPLFRGGAALVMLVLVIVKRNSTALFISYLLLLFPIIYFISLIFFIFEQNVNAQVKTYGDVIWWAGMTVTTVGSNIIPITSVGKVVTVLLAATGMTAFPVFTVYFTSIVSRLSQSDNNKQD